MIEDDFYCTIKLKHSGEEIFAKVAASEEEHRTMLIVSNPGCIEEIKMRGKTCGYKFEPWLKTTREDMFVMDMDKVITMSESNDMEIILMYQNFVRHAHKEMGNEEPLNRKMGYISNVNDAKENLEKIFKLDNPENTNS